MIFTIGQIVAMTIGTLLLAGWIYLFFAGRKYAPLFESLDEKEFPLRELYPIGYVFLEKTQYTFRSRSDLQLRQLMDVLFSRQYADYYMRTVRSQQVAIGLTLAVLSFGIYGLTNSPTLLVLMLIVTALAVYYFADQVKTRVRRRNDELVRDFCEVVSVLALLTNAGMILREAWAQTSLGGTSAIYQEMQLSVEQIQNGVSEADAIQAFGTRSMLPEIKKFTAILVQSIKKGGGDLPAILTAQSTESWHLKKQIIQAQGNKAGSKLLLPMLLMFGGILMIVIVPMFLSMGM